ncbi:putative bifunctional diguanylate cyclase/phosphodiesterase [Kineococcus sp. GCM10028916]|uniref:putative bifunctional diguanylate cyclase/phosphodiesterase n=1 Tax=Kineococcus sp. GCM10028916 TaxID=3273394 RepID=UPI0036D2C02A
MLLRSVLLVSAVLVLLPATGVPGDLASAGSRLAGVSFAVAVLRRKARTTEEERTVWRWLARAAAVVWAGTVAQFGVSAVAGASGRAGLELPGDVVLSASCLLACVLVYQGLIVWNRTSTRLADPGDWLNGISAGLAVSALLHLVIVWRPGGHERTLPWWVLEMSVARSSALFIVLGTTLTVAVMAGLVRDPRIWVIALGVVFLMAVEVATAFGVLRGGWSSSGWGLFCVVVAWASTVRARPVRPQEATTQSLTIGTFVVLLASVAIILLATRLPPQSTGVAVICGGLAVVGVSTRVVRLVSDLSTLAQTRQDALTDDLTGLANRRAFGQQLDLAAEGGDDVAVYLLDLDRFKEVNDRFGHAVGDRLLQRTAGRLAAVVPAGAVLARLGGDEFALLLPGADAVGAVRFAHELAAAVQGAGGVEGTGQVSASVGIALPTRADDPAGTPDGGELLRRADAAMYQAKSTGEVVRLYDDAIDRAGREEALMADELSCAFATGDASRQFRVHYQPQLDLSSGAVAGVEALVRWQHPRLGLLAPAAFLDLVERGGHMADLTEFVLREATAATGPRTSWSPVGANDVRVAVNLSASSLADPGLLVLLDELLAEGLDPTAVVLEVTETLLMSNPEQAVEMTREIRHRGFGLSIDDYGTGYSSLSYLVDLPATEVKLDRSFTVRLSGDDRVRQIVAGTVELAHRLGLRVVAEGVEDEATLEVLRSLGIDETQGYLHSRPLAPADVPAWVRGRSAPALSGGRSRSATAP